MRNGIAISDRKMVYWYIPKCACTTIKSVVATHLGMNVPMAMGKIHGLPFRYIWHNEAPAYRNWKHFAIVRHPMRRTLSLFNNKIFRDRRTNGLVSGGVVKNVFGAYGSLFHAKMSFSQFVDAICQVIDRNPDNHFRRMSEQLPDIPITILKAEDMAGVSDYLQSNSINAPVPHLNKTTGPEWLDNYTPEMAAKIEAAYLSDYEKFNYENPFTGL